MKVTLASSICLAALAATSFAGDKDCGKVVIENPCSFYVQAVAGASFFTDGDLLQEVTLPNGGINKVSFDDVYDDAATYGIRFGRACEKGRIYVGFEYTEAGGKSTEIGNVIENKVDPTIVGDFGTYSDYGLVLGVERDLFRGHTGGKNPVIGSKFRPWIGAQVGIRFVDGIDVTTHLVDDYGYVVPGSGSKVSLYDDTLVFTAAFTFGLAFDLTDRVTIGVESGLRYQTGLDGSDIGIGSANNDGDLLAIPVLGTVAIKF